MAGLRVAEPPLGQMGCLDFFFWFSIFYFLNITFFKKKKLGMGAFWGKKVKMVELQQFESLRGSSVTF
jgi:hypothetical protein